MDKIKKYKIPIIAACVVIVGALLIYYFNNREIGSKYFSIPDKKTINICAYDEICNVYEGHYDKIAYSKNIKEINDAIEFLNKETEQYYNQVLNSKMDDSCDDATKKTYKYSLSVYTYYTFYENSRYISFGEARYISRVCARTSSMEKTNYYVYDKKLKKMLTSKELQEQLHISDEKIYNSIKQSLKDFNKDGGANYKIYDKYDDVALYYENDGRLLISFYEPDTKEYLETEIIE